MPQIPAFLFPFLGAAYLVVLVPVLIGAWLALRRTELNRHVQAQTFITITVVLLGWFVFVWQFAKSDMFIMRAGDAFALIPLPIVLPILVIGALLIRSKRIAAMIDAIPHSWLVGIQLYRIMGGVFLVLMAQGLLPEVFALPAGIGDVLTGVLALFVALLLAARHAMARIAAYAWNIIGIGDFIIAVATGFLSAPGQMQMFAFDAPNHLINMYPLVMIPAFIVPVSILLHMLSLWKLRREAVRFQLVAG